MSGDRRTDGRTDGQTDRRTEHRHPHGAAHKILASAPGRGRTAPYAGPNTGNGREQQQGIDNGFPILKESETLAEPTLRRSDRRYEYS